MIMKKKQMLFSTLFAVLLLSLFALEWAGAAERTAPQVVSGVVEDIRGSSIVVNRKYYDISGVPVFTLKGVPISADLIKMGYAVRISIVNHVITRVTIDPKNPAQ